MSKNTTLKEFKNLANVLEKEYRQQGNIAKLYNKLFEICKSKGESDEVCKTNSTQAQIIISEIWRLRHVSNQNIVNAVAQKFKNNEPVKVSKEQKEALNIMNDINHQHDVQASKINGTTRSVQQYYFQAKQLVKDINQNYNNYYDVWSKLKDLETEYINGYKEYNAMKQQYQDQENNIPQNVIDKANKIYNHLTTKIIPQFKDANSKLEGLVQQRRKILADFYNIYLVLSSEEKQQISIPLTVFDIHRKIYSKMKYTDKPKARVDKCIEKSWLDAQKAGFNPTFFGACHILKQTDVLKCSSKFDWPYIEYEPNIFSPWDSNVKYADWINRCSSVENIKRPYIGV